MYGILGTIVIGLQIGIHAAYAAKFTASSYTDGYSLGVKDAGRDLQGLNGHGYDSSCPSGHTSVFCSAYVRGYDATWYGQDGSSQPRSSQGQSQGQSQSHAGGTSSTTTIATTLTFAKSDPEPSVKPISDIFAFELY